MSVIPSTRFHAKEKVIGPLNMSDYFEIRTPSTTWRMTKADFYRVFANVVRSKSYTGSRGEYHYPKPPRKAAQFQFR